MLYPPLKNDELRGSKEMQFIDRQETNFPQLMRLCMDFDLCVLQLQRKAFSHISKRYLTIDPVFVMANRGYHHNHSVYTPHCNSLQELESYARTHHVDILHAHLFNNAINEDYV